MTHPHEKTPTLFWGEKRYVFVRITEACKWERHLTCQEQKGRVKLRRKLHEVSFGGFRIFRATFAPLLAWYVRKRCNLSVSFWTFQRKWIFHISGTFVCVLPLPSTNIWRLAHSVSLILFRCQSLQSRKRCCANIVFAIASGANISFLNNTRKGTCSCVSVESLDGKVWKVFSRKKKLSVHSQFMRHRGLRMELPEGKHCR